jgi:ParB family chromosome partitioning protein
LAAETLLSELTGEVLAAKEAVEASGGVITGQYLDPLGGKPLLLAVLPIDQVEPTPLDITASGGGIADED